MDINQIGSIASILALGLTIIYGIFNAIKRYKIYVEEKEEESEKFRNLLISAVGKSTNDTQRAIAAALVQHMISSRQRKIQNLYFLIIFYLCLGTAQFLVFSYMNFLDAGFPLLLGFVTICALSFINLGNYQRDLRKSERDVGKAWAQQLDQAHAVVKK